MFEENKPESGDVLLDVLIACLILGDGGALLVVWGAGQLTGWATQGDTTRGARVPVGGVVTAQTYTCVTIRGVYVQKACTSLLIDVPHLQYSEKKGLSPF